MNTIDEWETMFRALRNIIRSAENFEEGLKSAFSVARGNPQVFDNPKFWAKAEQDWSRQSAGTVTSWSETGLRSLGPGDGWHFLLLDLGDCPETFRLYSPGGQDQMSEQAFRDLLLSRTYIEASELEESVVTDVDSSFDLLFGESRQEHSNRNIEELHDDVLTWNTGEDMDYQGNNGYFFWLMFGTLAFLEPLRQKDDCRQVLAGRDRLYLLSGFEEIFTYLATVTEAGLLFEGNVLPLLLPEAASQDETEQLMLPLE